MDAAWIGLVLTAGLFTMIVLSWPYRRARGFTLRRRIAAPRERVWDAYVVDLDHPGNAAFHHNTVSVETVSDDPEVRDHTFDLSGGHGTNLVTARIETLAAERPALYRSRHRSIGGAPYPFGPKEATKLQLSERAGGTAAVLDWHGETATLWQLFNVWRSSRSFLKRLQCFAENGRVQRPSQGRGSLWTSLALSVIAVGSFAVWLGWVGALVLAAVLVVHEFGHWLAMRLTGQPAPRMLLIPFFGGVAVANHPHKSLFDDAFCSLMGPGFSALLAIGFLVAAHLMSVDGTPPPLGELAVFGLPYRWLWLVSLILAFLVGLINLFQLLPVLPLDGGHVLRALVQSFHAPAARWILLVVTLLAAVAFALADFYLFAGILVLGALQAWHMSGKTPKALPMGPGQAATIVAGFLFFSAVHGTAVYFGARLIGWSPF